MKVSQSEIERMIVFFSAISTLFTLCWVLWFCRYGIDFTDEGFYLVWMSNPFNYSMSTPPTQFGFIYHPLHELLNGNVAALRQVNILITFSLAWVLSNVFLKTVFGNQALDRASRLTISAAISTVSFVFLQLWLPTPSYNWLALQALLVTAIGLLLTDKVASRESIIGWLLIGVGGWLAFMAKPTTAAALALLSVFYLLGSKKLQVRLLAISLITAVVLLVFSALTIDGSITLFIERLQGGVEIAALLDAGHNLIDIFRLDNFQLGERAKLILIAGTAVFFAATYLSQSKIKALVYCSAALSIAFGLASLAVIFGLNHKVVDDGHFRGLLIWSVPFASIFVGFAFYKFKGFFQFTRPQWALALTFFIFPYVYAFGSNNTYWELEAWAGIFWVLASLVFLSPIAANRKLTALLLPLGLAVQLVTVALVQTGMEAPYRQPRPLRENDYKIELERGGATLLVAKEFGRYFEDAVDLANKIQFLKGTSMIDLTGQSPSILYAISANSLGDAWIIGGYPGSDKVAVAVLKKVSCEALSRAWLLTEPEGPTKISSEVLLSFGANLATDFEIVGTLRTAEGAGGIHKIRLQHFLKPIRSSDAAMTACVARRTHLTPQN